MVLTWFMIDIVLTLHRFVLASTQELHEKITELCSRIRDLEDGLRTAHTKNSSDPHPLLSDDLMRVKAPLQREAPPRNPTTIHQQEEENNPDVIDSFGTLAINGAGHTSYHSGFANSWVRRQLAPLHINALTSFTPNSTSCRFARSPLWRHLLVTYTFYLRMRWKRSQSTSAPMTFVTSYPPTYFNSAARSPSLQLAARLSTR